MALSWQDSIIRGALVIGDIMGTTVVANPSVLGLSVRPLTNTGHKATGVIVYPTDECYFAVKPTVSTSGLRSAILVGEQEYVFPLQPNIDTLYFLDAQSDSKDVYVRFVMVD